MKYPNIPTNPITIGLNGIIRDSIFKNFVHKYLKGYEVVESSKYRSIQKNIDVGGAKTSAHLYNLAIDFELHKNGKKLTSYELSKVFSEKIKPNWKGYALDEGDHIHLNLDRKVTVYTSIALGTGVLAIAYYFYNK